MKSTSKEVTRESDNGLDTAGPEEKKTETIHTPSNGFTATETDNNSDQESLDHEAQAGVKAVQAAAAVWTKSQLALAYVM